MEIAPVILDSGCNDGPVRSFDSAAEEYDLARPSYPRALYDLVEAECGEFAGKTVADGGAGTGVVTRGLIERHAEVVAIDPGLGMLGKAIARTPGLRAVVADAAVMPLRSACLDLICFGQSWHWVDQEEGTREVARVLKDGCWWAAWWNHPWADSEDWFDRYYSLLEIRCKGLSRDQRNVDWCSEAVAGSGLFQPVRRHIVEWERRVSIRDWLIDLRSHSYVIDFSDTDRTRLLTDVESILRDAFASGTVVVPYQTRVWMARRTA